MKVKSLRTKITLWTVTAMLVIPVTVGAVIILKQFTLASHFEKTIQETDNLFKETLLKDLEEAMMANQLNGMRSLLARLAEFKGVQGVYLTDAHGNDVLGYGTKDAPMLTDRQWEQVLTSGQEVEVYSQDNGETVRLIAMPIVNKDKCRPCHTNPGVNGALLIRQRSVDVKSETSFLVIIMLISLMVASVAGALTLLILLTRKVVDPIRELSGATEKIGHCELDVRVPVGSDDEVGELAQSFNRMIDDLKKSRDEVEERSKKLVQAYQEMTAAQKKLIQSEKLAAIGTLVAGIAHEINNPVGIIAARTDCMLLDMGDGVDGQFKDDLMVINRQAGRIADITRALLTFARQAPAELKPVDVNSVVEDTIFLVAKAFMKEGITLQPQASANIPLVLANDNRIQQVLLDLLNNSRDAMPGGGTIIVATAASGNKVEITIADTGEGIPEDVLDKIFDPFFTTKDVGRGTGLGLAVSYGIIQDMGGNIEVRSKSGEGTAFTITMPKLKEN